MAISSPKGMRDMLPDEAAYWHEFQRHAREIFKTYGYIEIITPIVERTELFVRGIGEATDVVSKEMFNVISDENLHTLVGGGHIGSNKRLSLRPEGTAGVVRAMIEHDLVPQGAPPAKLMYAGPMFRAEQPQEGRYRQFRQIGIECLGSNAPSIDAEGIVMCMHFFNAIGFDADDMALLVNSMGCPNCRPAYRERLSEYLTACKDELCDKCAQRMEINPLRMFDCKDSNCRHVMENAPKITDHLCDECRDAYARVLAMLDSCGIRYVQDPSLVRGLDYYTRTVFEVQLSGKDSAQNAIGGGGRYDNLAGEVRGDGKSTPGFGFAIGYERCKEALIKKGMTLPEVKKLDVFIACVTDEMRAAAFELSEVCRDYKIVCDMDHQSRSLKSQFKVADRLHAKFVVILGPDEIAQNQAKVRNMNSHDEELIDLKVVPHYLKEQL